MTVGLFSTLKIEIQKKHFQVTRNSIKNTEQALLRADMLIYLLQTSSVALLSLL